MVHFELRDFVLDGVLGGVRPGMTRSETESVLGSPDDWGMSNEVATAPIWRFGRFEVHFGDDDRAWLLFTDYLDPLDPGPGRTIDPWFFDGSSASRTWSAVASHLEREGRVIHRERVSSEARSLRIENGASLYFDGTVDASLCSAISAVASGFERGRPA